MNRRQYEDDIVSSEGRYPVPVEVVESDEDLYWHIAHAMYFAVAENAARSAPTVMIVPVGPVFQYRRFVDLVRKYPVDLSGLRLFFMDEYLDEAGNLVDRSDPLSFRGFVDREFLQPLSSAGMLGRGQIFFPDPARPQEYDRALAELGNAEICIAGVGITGHLAFNDPPEPGETVSETSFRALPTRVVSLSRETVAINSNTAMRGAYEQIPHRAITVGMKQILASRSLRIYLNRPWQSAVVRKLLYETAGPAFPATLTRSHPDVRVIMTRQVALAPEFMLR